jgi:uncharacterized membrane protein
VCVARGVCLVVDVDYGCEECFSTSVILWPLWGGVVAHNMGWIIANV